MDLQAVPTPIAGLLVVEPVVHADDRGFFLETYERSAYLRLGIDVDFVQDNQARSSRGTLRGLHFQKCHPQAKLVRVVRGEIYDVAVDLRRSASTFGRWFGVRLDAIRHHQLYVPVGFAHGYLALTEGAEIVYKCSERYHPEDEGGLRWDDPQVGIAWPLEGLGCPPRLSAKDRQYPGLACLEHTFP